MEFVESKDWQSTVKFRKVKTVMKRVVGDEMSKLNSSGEDQRRVWFKEKYGDKKSYSVLIYILFRSQLLTIIDDETSFPKLVVIMGNISTRSWS